MSGSRGAGCLFEAALGLLRLALNVLVMVAMAIVYRHHGADWGIATGVAAGAVVVLVSWRIVQPRAERLATRWFGPEKDADWSSAASRARRAVSPGVRYLWLAQLVFVVVGASIMFLHGPAR